jgi:hypothetical protein
MITTPFLAEWALRSSILILSGALLLWVLRVKDASIRLAGWTAMRTRAGQKCGSQCAITCTFALGLFFLSKKDSKNMTPVAIPSIQNASI